MKRLLGALALLALLLVWLAQRNPALTHSGGPPAPPAAPARPPPPAPRPALALAPAEVAPDAAAPRAPCAVALYGVVRDSGGGAIAGALISAREWQEPPVALSRSGAGGAYELCLPASRWQVSASAEGFAELESEVTLYGRVQRDLVLWPGATLGGVVVQAEDDAPLPGVELLLRNAHSFDEQPAVPYSRSLRADGEGRFHASGVVPGRYLLTVKHLDRSGQLPVKLVAAEERSSLRVLTTRSRASSPAPPLTRIRGRVTHQGMPAPGARVHTFGAALSWTPAWTDAEGRFELSGPAGVVTVSAEHRGLALRGSAPPVVVDPGETHDGLVIELNLNGEIAGVVSYEDGEPYQGAVLHLRRSAAGIVDQARVDEAGRFKFFGLRAGRYDVNVAGPSRCKPAEPSEGALPTLQLREGERLGGVRLVLRGRGLTLRGRVVGSAGEPRGGVAVKVGCDHGSALDLVDPLRAMTAADGRFRLQVPPSPTPLIIQAYDGVGAVVTQRAVRADASEHLLTLSEASAP